MLVLYPIRDALRENPTDVKRMGRSFYDHMDLYSRSIYKNHLRNFYSRQ